MRLLQFRAALLNPYASGPSLFYGGALGDAPRPLSSHALVRALDEFETVLRASTEPWPKRIDAIKAVGTWPAWPSVFIPNKERDRLTKVLDNFTTRTAEQVRIIRCGRLIISPTPLDLIDPFTGSRLDARTCRL